MKRSILVFLSGAAIVALGIFSAFSQTPQGNPADAAKKQQKRKENLPYDRFHPAREPYVPTAEEKQEIQAKIDQLSKMIAELRAKGTSDAVLPDVEIYLEAAKWKMYYPEEFFSNAKQPKKPVTDTLKALDIGIERAGQLKEGKSPWTTQKGLVVRGYRSAVDGSVQPVRVTVPEEYDGVTPVPLDVAQHGRFTTLYEVETLTSNQGMEIDYLPHTLQIDLFGRGKNTYQWPGETDIFEAIAFTKGAYKIDPDRMLLRGFSMGGAGVWHTSLHQPDLWTAVELGAGDNRSLYVPAVDTLPDYQKPMLKILDNMYEWAPNAYNIPFVSYVGENDGSYIKHELAKAELEKGRHPLHRRQIPPKDHRCTVDHIFCRSQHRSRDEQRGTDLPQCLSVRSPEDWPRSSGSHPVYDLHHAL